jgi:hypothetical protein
MTGKEFVNMFRGSTGGDAQCPQCKKWGWALDEFLGRSGLCATCDPNSTTNQRKRLDTLAVEAGFRDGGFISETRLDPIPGDPYSLESKLWPIWFQTIGQLRDIGAIDSAEELSLLDPYYEIVRRRAEKEAELENAPFLLVATLVRYEKETEKFHSSETQTKIIGDDKNMEFVLHDNEKGVLSLQVVTKAGNPANIDGAITYEHVNPEDSRKLTLFPSPDTRSCEFVTQVREQGADPTTGAVQVRYRADADLGEGVAEISDVVTINIIPAATAGGFTATFGGIQTIR